MVDAICLLATGFDWPPFGLGSPNAMDNFSEALFCRHILPKGFRRSNGGLRLGKRRNLRKRAGFCIGYWKAFYLFVWLIVRKDQLSQSLGHSMIKKVANVFPGKPRKLARSQVTSFLPSKEGTATI
ncbi:cytochrome P450 [Striga asiatica]|uniref:Cytochrome P450 n=1 Tax=Striga asiatica TaxID=4170 RepID=A0A5A7PTN5_STRAF|nr:cytochrome P450 [Striga asiatica]